jgi:hypothetical protein
MDRKKNRVTSERQFRGELMRLLQRAIANLTRDGDLHAIALMEGYPMCKQIAFINIPAEEGAKRLREETRDGDYESVIYITTALVREVEGGEGPLYRYMRSLEEFGGLEGAARAILIEGAHRQFGTHAAHVTFRPDGVEHFMFGEPHCGPCASPMVLQGLWAARLH